jgi:hypothetical protein
LERKLKDLSLAARVHQRYRVIAEVAKGWTILEAADRVGCLWSAIIRAAAATISDTCKRGPTLA